MTNSDRPDGETMRTLAFVMGAIAIIALLMYILTPPEVNGEINEHNIATRGWCIIALQISIPLGTMLAIASAILRAIWFLPARDLGDAESADPANGQY